MFRAITLQETPSGGVSVYNKVSLPIKMLNIK